MSVIYVREQGASIQKCGERIQVVKNRKNLLDVPVFQIDSLVIIGNVQITTQALHLLMGKGVDVNYFSFSGEFIGSAAAEASRNIFLRFEQYRLYLNEEERIKTAKVITEPCDFG